LTFLKASFEPVKNGGRRERGKGTNFWGKGKRGGYREKKNILQGERRRFAGLKEKNKEKEKQGTTIETGRSIVIRGGGMGEGKGGGGGTINQEGPLRVLPWSS